jgi:L-amino acid N-acyltransferase YncA
MKERGGLQVRLATEDDLVRVCEIVNYFIEKTVFNFRTEPQAVDEWRDEWARLHERHGFIQVGRLVDAGFKRGGWHDVGFWRCTLRSGRDEIPPPQPVQGWQPR